MMKYKQRLQWLTIIVTLVCSGILLGNWCYKYFTSREYYNINLGVVKFNKDSYRFVTSCNTDIDTNETIQNCQDCEFQNGVSSVLTVETTITQSCDCTVYFNDKVAKKHFNETITLNYNPYDTESCEDWCNLKCHEFGTEKFGIEQ